MYHYSFSIFVQKSIPTLVQFHWYFTRIAFFLWTFHGLLRKFREIPGYCRKSVYLAAISLPREKIVSKFEWNQVIELKERLVARFPEKKTTPPRRIVNSQTNSTGVGVGFALGGRPWGLIAPWGPNVRVPAGSCPLHLRCEGFHAWQADFIFSAATFLFPPILVTWWWHILRTGLLRLPRA